MSPESRVDVGGADRTTYCLGRVTDGGMRTEALPAQATLREMRKLAELSPARVVIDAHLSWNCLDDTGLRGADHELRRWLRGEGLSVNWVQGIFSLYAVPVKGRMIQGFFADGPSRVIETHPRVCLARLLGEGCYVAVTEYKRAKATEFRRAEARRKLAAGLRGIGITGWPTDDPTDDQIDAAVCAYVAAGAHTLEELDLGDCTHVLAPFQAFRAG